MAARHSARGQQRRRRAENQSNTRGCGSVVDSVQKSSGRLASAIATAAAVDCSVAKPVSSPIRMMRCTWLMNLAPYPAIVVQPGRGDGNGTGIRSDESTACDFDGPEAASLRQAPTRHTPVTGC